MIDRPLYNRAGFKKGGSRQPGMEHAVNKAAREKITRDVRNLQQQMAERGGGAARDYVSQHNLNKAIAKRKEGIKEIIPPGPSDRHPGTEKIPLIDFTDKFKDEWFRNKWAGVDPWGQDLQYPYESEDDLPEGILTLLKKDPAFNLEEFKKIGWSAPENVWYEGGKGLQGVYLGGYPKGIEKPILPINQVPPGERGKPKLIERKAKVKVPPSGPPSERVWDPEKLKDPKTFTPSALYADTINLQHNPFKKDDSPWIANPNIPTSYVGSSRSSNVDKARTALHELRHKKFVENPELWKSQPEWVKNVEMPGTEEYWQNMDKYGYKKYMTGHELYNRFLDQRYFPPTRNPESEPYFDKILKDLWEPSAKKYEKIINEYDLSPVNLADGGRAGYKDGETVLPQKKPWVPPDFKGGEPPPKNLWFLKKLLSQEARNTLGARTWTDLTFDYAKKAHEAGQISDETYKNLIMPLFGEKGEQLTEAIAKHDELNKGGRVGLVTGSGDYAKKYLKHGDKPTQDKFNRLVNDLRTNMSLESAISEALREIRAGSN